MALEFNAANQYSLPVRWGDILGGINEANTFAATTVAARANNLSADYLTVARQGDVIDGLYAQATDVRSDVGDWRDYLFGLMQTTLQAMCRDDTARPRTDDLAGWFDKVNRDMKAGNYIWDIPDVGATVAVPGTNAGDGYLITSVVEPVDGLETYYAYGEVIRLECTADSYDNSTDAGAEEFSVYGETSVEKTDPTWPKGSGAETTLTAVDPTTSEEVTDGAFDEWTSTNTPTEWGLLTGTAAGTHVFQEADTADVYTTGGKAIRFQGDGATAGLGIYQALDQDVVTSNTNYAVSVWYRSGATSVVTGADLRIAFTDGDGTVVDDNFGTAQSDTITNTNFTDADATWTRKTVVLRTPRNLPTELRLELKFTGTLILHASDVAKMVWLDHLTMSPMEQLYAGGPYLAIHAGNTPFALGDAFTDTVTNDETTAGFVRCLDRTFDLADNGIRLIVHDDQVAGSATTIDDALIV